jgi:arabinose-5-phosphate isomerase
MVKMTESRLGAVTLVNEKGAVAGIFTDGDLRRRLQADGRNILDKTLAQIGFSKTPVTIARDRPLDEAVKLFKKHQVDSIVVVDGEKPVGALDIQDLVKLGLLGQEFL